MRMHAASGGRDPSPLGDVTSEESLRETREDEAYVPLQALARADKHLNPGMYPEEEFRQCQAIFEKNLLASE